MRRPRSLGTLHGVDEPVPDDVRVCRLSQAVGPSETCPEERCAFWEQATGRCAFDELDLSGRHDLAGWLLGIRAELESGPEPG